MLPKVWAILILEIEIVENTSAADKNIEIP